MPAELFAIIAPVFASAGVGFAWAKSGQRYDVDFVTSLVTNIGAPMLVFSTLLNLDNGLAAFFDMMAAAALTIVLVMAAAAALLLAARLPLRSFLPALTFSNAGNMGLPLCLFAFGERGLALGIAFFSVASIANFTIGVWIASGSSNPLELARTPMIWAVAAALAAMGADVAPPLWLLRSAELIGGFTIPLMLITLGVSLARLKIASIPRSAALSLARLVLGFAAGVAIGHALNLDPLARGVLIIQAAAPVAVFNYLFAQRYKRQSAEVAGMVLLSTAMSFAALPALLWFVLT